MSIFTANLRGGVVGATVVAKPAEQELQPEEMMRRQRSRPGIILFLSVFIESANIQRPIYLRW